MPCSTYMTGKNQLEYRFLNDTFLEELNLLLIEIRELKNVAKFLSYLYFELLILGPLILVFNHIPDQVQQLYESC